MVVYEDMCVGCSTIFHSCLGSSCPNTNVKILICDECQEEVDELYEFEGEEMCVECIKKRLVKVAG